MPTNLLKVSGFFVLSALLGKEKEKPVYHYSKDGGLLESYKNLRQAETATGMSIKKLKYMSYNGDLRRKKGSMTKVDYWSRMPPQ